MSTLAGQHTASTTLSSAIPSTLTRLVKLLSHSGSSRQGCASHKSTNKQIPSEASEEPSDTVIHFILFFLHPQESSALSQSEAMNQIVAKWFKNVSGANKISAKAGVRDPRCAPSAMVPMAMLHLFKIAQSGRRKRKFNASVLNDAFPFLKPDSW